MMWPKGRLADVAELSLGKMLDQNKNKGNLRPYLANVNVRWGSLDLEHLREMRFEPHESERYGLRYDDIIMCEGGEPGRCAIWREQIPGMMLQKALHRIRAKPGFDPLFLFYCLFHQGRSGALQHLFTGATIKHLPGEQLAKVEVPEPPPSIQRRIASILGAYDDLIELNRRQIALLEEMARRLFEEWFVHFRFPGHEGHPMVDTAEGRLPQGWRNVRLEEIYTTSSGGTPSRKCPHYYGGDIRWVKTKELLDGPIFESEEHITEEAIAQSSAKIFPSGTVLVAMYGANIGQLGVLARPAATNQACCAVMPTSDGPGWAYAYLSLRHTRHKLIGLRAGAAQQNISQSIIRNFSILRPLKSVFGRFEETAVPFLSMSFVLHQQNATLAASRDLLLPRLISGELSVAAAERELEMAA